MIRYLKHRKTMVGEKITRGIALGVMLIALGGCIYYAILSFDNYDRSELNLQQAQTVAHIEILRFMSDIDSTPLKAIYYINPDQVNYANHSVPVVIFCHGMGEDYLSNLGLYQLLMQA